MGAKFARRATLGLMFALAACGGSGSDDGDGDGDANAEESESSDAPRATIPRPTAPAGTAAPAATTTDLLDRLPKAADIGPLQLGIPAVAAIRSIALEFDADPSGPCGAALTPLTLDGAAGRTYDTVKGRIVGIGIPRSAATDTFVAENTADLTAGCPSHTTTLSTGDEQTLSAPEVIDISAIAPDGIAWTAAIEAPEPGHKATVLLQATDLTVVVSMTSPEPIEPTLIEAIATVWTEAAAAA
jgi:hypothetical protein